MNDTAHISPAGTFKTRKEFVERFDLVEWVHRKCNRYQEPERRGIPRDEKRPVPKNKFEAEAHMLLRGNWTEPTLKRLAERIGISYSLYRKWTADPEFQKSIIQLRDEYLDGFFDFFLKALDELHESSQLKTKDVATIDHEAANFYYLVLLIDLADYSWGTVIKEIAHEKIQEILKSKKLDGFAGFLQFLDLICYSKHVSRNRVLECRNALDELTNQFHHDLCVASYRQRPKTVVTYSSAITTLARLAISKFCSSIGKPKKREMGPDAMMPLNTPTEYMAKNLPHVV